ncbi:hypothetical protein [Psychroserpens sp. SPM9]|uniref:hypothetical protein n=1 Tax=Psychroserpens sp. SPM9 TaxID=2975598 RepID=UPI0021A61F7C|nr:hypothetical protein [Psychroserpens sp. SPM9]MDG5490489.1 hypothetical protein [Psychroserpens sp. SPM9]
MDTPIIVSEREKSLWKLVFAALCFTISLALLAIFIMQFYSDNHLIKKLASQAFYFFYLTPIGISLCAQKKIYVDLKNTRFKSSYEIGPLKFGKWVTIKNYEYVSVFFELLSNGTPKFKVNLWCDNNRHFNLYNRDNYLDAFTVGYYLSEELSIDLLDATVPNDYKWIDKADWKRQMNADAS